MKNHKSKKIIICVLLILFIVSIISITPPIFEFQEDEYIDAVVFFEPNYNIDNIPGVIYKYKWDALNGFSGKIPYKIYVELEQSPHVKSIHQIDCISSLAQDSLDTGISDIQAERVWGGSEDARDVDPGNPDGDEINILICDTGINYNHGDLWSNYKWGYDWYDNDDDPMDLNNHGTFCAGIVGSADNNYEYIGVAPNINIYNARVAYIDVFMNSHVSIDGLISAIYWATFPENRDIDKRPPSNPRMDIISMSIQLQYDFAGLQSVIGSAFDEGLTLVAASGNEVLPSFPVDAVYYPAKYSQVIAVGAAEKVNGLYERADFSCYDSEIDVVAPGVEIWSIVNYFPYHDSLSGTSFACPMVAGVCALIMSANPYLKYHPIELKDILTDTADDIGDDGRDDETGYGLVNAENAVIEAINRRDDDPPSVNIISPTSSLVHDTVLIKASADDNVGVHYVQCKIGSGPWMDDYSSPYQWDWDTTPYDNGEQVTIRCKAWDETGNSNEATKTVTVLNGGSGGGSQCPNLLIWDGTAFVDEGVLPIHDEENPELDVIYIHEIETNPYLTLSNKYTMKLSEISEDYNFSQSFINEVQLFAQKTDSLWVNCNLTSAYHSTKGNVKNLIKKDDDKRVEIIKGEDITLEFSGGENYIQYLFVLVGHNFLKN